MQIYRAIGIDGSCFPSKGDYFAKDADSLVSERVEIFGAYAGGCFGGHCRCEGIRREVRLWEEGGGGGVGRRVKWCGAWARD